MSRSGVTLFLVLVSIAAMTVGASLLAIRAANSHRGLRLDHEDRQFEILHADAVFLTAGWLRSKGASISTPVDAPHRGTIVLDSEARWGETVCSMRVTVWDAASGIPCLVEQFPWTDLLPSDIIPPATVVRPEAWWQSATSDVRRRFPDPSSDPDEAVTPLCLEVAAFGGGQVNWRTAPWPVVLAVLRHHDASHLAGPLLAARNAGGTFAFPSDWRPQKPPFLTASASRWLVLVEMRIGERTRRSLDILSGSDSPKATVRYAL